MDNIFIEEKSLLRLTFNPGLALTGFRTTRSSTNTHGKWDDIFRLSLANQQKWLLPLFIPLANSLIRAKNRFVKNGTANFGRNIPTEISRPSPEVIPNFPIRRNRDGFFHLTSDRNFRNLWHNGKHPLQLFLCCCFFPFCKSGKIKWLVACRCSCGWTN